MNTSIFHRALYLTLLTLIFLPLYSQIDDIGITIDSGTRLTVRDSLEYLIYEGESPFFDQAVEGAAIEFYGEKIESVVFRLFDQTVENKAIAGKIFRQPDLDKVVATFLEPIEDVPAKYSFKIISEGDIEINRMIIFPVDQEKPGKARALEPIISDIPKPVVISREEWDAEEPKNAYSYHPYFDKLTLHHAACCSADDLEEGKDQVRWIQDFHQNGRGWSDIGYHFLVDRAGNIYQGRPETVIGAHVGGANTGNIGICLLGCYHPPEASCFQTITPESRQSIVEIFSWVSDTYGQSPAVLLGHRDYFGTTACPGDNIWIELPRFRAEIADFIQDYFEVPPISMFQLPFPNPFSNYVTLSFDLKNKMDFKIDIFDLLGRKVNTIKKNNAGSGRLIMYWDGKNINGQRLGSGVYFAKPISNEKIDPIKVILLRK
ncbi:MAG: hypothetical protein CBD77_04845 [bacterium TMED217]|nr:MAG: hypothetical protein CBD77_04845 [bacterium TMED217]